MEDTTPLQNLKGKTLAILGYREDGPEMARWFRDQGIAVVIGLREWWDQEEWDRAQQDGFLVTSPEEAT